MTKDSELSAGEDPARLRKSCGDILRALDRLEWARRDSFAMPRHRKGDWMRRIPRALTSPSHGGSAWFAALAAHLDRHGYGQGGMVGGRTFCLFQRVVGPVDFGPHAADFDEEDRKWIQRALSRLATMQPGKTFLDLTKEYIRDRFKGDELEARRTAWVNRKTYSKMKKTGGVSKRTVLQFAFAFQLTWEEAEIYLDEAQTNADLIAALREECQLKKDGDKTARIGFGV